MNAFHIRFGRMMKSNQITISEESLRRILVEENIDTPTIINILHKVKIEKRFSFLDYLPDFNSRLGTLNEGNGITIDIGLQRKSGNPDDETDSLNDEDPRKDF